MERGSGHNDKLDLWKCVAIYSVIFIHILLPGQIGVAVNCLARFAVPLFFLSAGFFSWRSPPRVLSRRTVRTAGLLLFACLALLGLGCAMARHGGASMGAYLLGRFTWANAASLVLWQLFPLPYSWPLWFLAALLMIYLMWWGLTALLRGRLPHRLLAVLALGLLALAAGACLLWLARGWHQGRPSDFALPTLAPALFACVWLLTAERSRASNPVVEVYLWFFFAIIALVLACYTGAGFSFRNGRPAAARTFCWLAVYFALLTLLGDSHSVQEYLLLAGGALWCAAQGEALSGTAWRQPPPEKAPAAAEAEADDGEDDVDFVL